MLLDGTRPHHKVGTGGQHRQSSWIPVIPSCDLVVLGMVVEMQRELWAGGGTWGCSFFGSDLNGQEVDAGRQCQHLSPNGQVAICILLVLRLLSSWALYHRTQKGIQAHFYHPHPTPRYHLTIFMPKCHLGPEEAEKEVWKNDQLLQRDLHPLDGGFD